MVPNTFTKRGFFVAIFSGFLMTSSARSDSQPGFMKLWDFKEPAATEARFREVLAKPETREDPSVHVQLLTQIARTEGLQGRREEAHRTLDEAEALLVEGMNTARVHCHLERGRTVNGKAGGTDPAALERAAASVPHFLAAWELAKSSGEDALALDAAHMMAIVAPAGERMEWSRRAIEVAEASTNPNCRGWLGPLYNNTGWDLHDKGDHEGALEMFRKGVEFRRAGGGAGFRISRWSEARALRSLGRIDEAMAIQRDLESAWAAEGEPDAYVFEEIGECLVAQGEKDDAKYYFARAHELLIQDEWFVANEGERVARMAELGGIAGD